MKQRMPFTFSQKIIFTELISLLLPLTLILFLCYSSYTSMVLQDVKSVSRQQANFLSQYLSSSFMSTNHNLTVWMNNNHVRDYFESEDYDPKKLESLQEALIDLCTFESYYQNAYLYHAGSQQVCSAFSEGSDDDIDYQSTEFQTWVSSVSKIYSFHIGLYPFGRDSSVFCIIPVRSYGSHHFLGYCMLKLSTTLIKDAFSICNYPYGNLYCIDANGNVLFSTDHSSTFPVDFALLPTSGNIQTLNHQFVYNDVVSRTDISVISICPDSIYTYNDTISFYSVMMVSIVFIIFCLLVSILLLKMFLHPIQFLAKTMKEADPNNLKTVPLTNSHDEIRILEETYNELILRIQKMVITQYQSNLAVKDARLRALQLQINPHFVNNTLQMIGTLAAEREMMDIYDLICAFSRTFHYCLKYKGDLVTFNDELNYLNDYIMIQEGRFPGKFKFLTMIDDRTKNLEIPKMSLQPLIENSFIHSFGCMNEQWEIQIRSGYYGSYYTIIIEDNGCGMDEEALQKLQRQLEEMNTDNPFHTHKSIGLKNVNIRIKLLYGSEYGIKIDSKLLMGTKIILILPAKKGEIK